MKNLDIILMEFSCYRIKQGGKEILRMVATDGHRLSLVDRENQKFAALKKGMIIPKKGVLEIKKDHGR